MMSLSDPGEVVEVDHSGKIVRSIAGDNMDIQFGWASGFAVVARWRVADIGLHRKTYH